MNSAIQVFNYEGSRIRTIEIDGEVWFVGKDVASVLKYSNTREALMEHVDEEDRKVLLKSENATLGFDIPNRGLTIINESGLYSLILSSKLPTARKFKHWVTSEVLPQIYSTGSFSAGTSNEELDIRRRELDIKGAEIIKSILETQPFPMTPETKTVLGHEAFQLITGKNYLSMLPECTERWFTAGELGAELGISANKVGRIAKANGIKAPEGQSNEYGRWIFSKSRHSSREVPSFIYNENALEWFISYGNGTLLGG
ncbi:MAG: hypothetical protein IJS28_07100 [Synergistaceae bacterium]|nr:hypothetical protein [Synergistaceae bacterium]